MHDEEWGPWIEHDGRGCPCRGTYAMAEFDGGYPAIGEGPIPMTAGDHPKSQWWWWKADKARKPRIIRYRIRKPRGMKALEELLQNLPEGVDA